jgi:hypothetical protein
MSLETSAGMTVLTIKVDSPATELSASLFAHDIVNVAYRKNLNLSPTDDPHTWVTSWQLDPRLPPLLEIGNVSIGPFILAPLDPGPKRWIFLKPDAGDGIWISDQRAEAERQSLEILREYYFAGPLVAPETTPNAPEFYVLAIADNLLLTQEQRVPGMTLAPMTSVLGDDIRLVLNELLQQRGFHQPLDQGDWRERMRSDKPAVVIECRVKAETPDAAQIFSSEVIKRMLALMTLRRGAAARLIAGVVGQQTDSGNYDVGTVWIEHSGYFGNLVGSHLRRRHPPAAGFVERSPSKPTSPTMGIFVRRCRAGHSLGLPVLPMLQPPGSNRRRGGATQHDDHRRSRQSSAAGEQYGPVYH